MKIFVMLKNVYYDVKVLEIKLIEKFSLFLRTKKRDPLCPLRIMYSETDHIDTAPNSTYSELTQQ